MVYANMCSISLFCCSTSQSTAMVMWWRVSSPSHTFSWASLSSWPVLCPHTFARNWQQPFLNESVERRRMTIEIISWPSSKKVWDWAGIELSTPWSAVRCASVVRHISNCATWPGVKHRVFNDFIHFIANLLAYKAPVRMDIFIHQIMEKKRRVCDYRKNQLQTMKVKCYFHYLEQWQIPLLISQKNLNIGVSLKSIKKYKNPSWVWWR